MTLKLEIVSEHKDIVGDDAVREFTEDGGTIGRSLQNDWILPDPDRYISGKHAVVDFKGGIYYLVDLSTNGIYVNDEHEPIGKGNPRRLFNGDRLRMGDFELVATVDKGESLVMPLDDDDPVIDEDIEQLIPETSLKTGVQLLDEEELTGDDEFQSTLFASDPSKSTPIDINVELDDELLDDLDYDLNETKAGDDGKPERAAAPVIQPTRVGVTSDDLFDVFLDGLGISRSELHPSVDPAEVMQNAGEVMREFIDGIFRLLASRTNLKVAFRLDQTTVLPRHNNPLKLSTNTTESIKQLLVGREGEYLGPRDAVREVCRDLLFHQDAFLDAMTAAFVEFADRFDPDELTASFERSGESKSLFGLGKERRYWQLYCDLYPVMTEKGGGRFPHMFGEEFVKAYERQIAEFKRVNPDDLPHPKPVLEPLSEEEYEEELKKTVSLDQPDAAGEASNDAADEDAASNG